MATALLPKCLLRDVGSASAAQLPATAAGWLLGRRQFRQCFPATRSQSTAYPVYLGSILILSSHLCLGPPSDPVSSDFSTKPCMHLFSLICAMCLAHLIVLWIHGGTAHSGTALQARRLRVWFSMGLLDNSAWSFWLHYASGVDSESNRNEYQEYLLGGKGGRCVGLTTLPP